MNLEKMQTIMISIKPRIDVEFYGLPCSSGAFGPYFGLIEHDTEFPVLEWELFAGIERCHGVSSRRTQSGTSRVRCEPALLREHPRFGAVSDGCVRIHHAMGKRGNR